LAGPERADDPARRGTTRCVFAARLRPPARSRSPGRGGALRPRLRVRARARAPPAGAPGSVERAASSGERAGGLGRSRTTRRRPAAQRRAGPAAGEAGGRLGARAGTDGIPVEAPGRADLRELM